MTHISKKSCFTMATGLTLLLAVLFSARTALGQGAAASVSGVVTDNSGARLPGVTVTITNTSNGRSQAIVTAQDGKYRAVALQPTTYEITAELAGFATVKREILLTVGANLTVDLTLPLAGVEESVTVVGESPLLEISKSQLRSVVEVEQIDTLPNLRRNFLDLAQLLPGSGPDNSRVQYFNPTKFGGAADQRNAFTTMIDGGNIDDAIWGSTTVNISQEAVQEFNVLRNQFDAEYGAALNSVVTVVTRSGTNQLKGSGFYYGRDRKLNARDFFVKEKPPFDQQRYGASLGGPIARDKTHVFGAYEFSNVDTVNVIAHPAVSPFAAAENGVFPSGAQNHMVSSKLTHRINDAHSLAVRYFYDNQDLLRTQSVSSDTNQIDEYSRSHSVVAEETWVFSQNKVNTLRFHYLNQNVGNTPHSNDVMISRPSVATGQSWISPQFFPRTRSSLYNTLYVNTPRHELKFGGELSFAASEFEAHFYEHGRFDFGTDAPFNSNDPRTWPFAFTIQKNGFYEYRSKQIAVFAHDDWQLTDRLRLNLGVRYDLDTNLRDNDFYNRVIADPAFAGIEAFISRDRGNDYNNIQPRLGFAWDLSGAGELVLRGGYGLYVTRNRPWFQLTSRDRTLGGAVRIEDPARLRLFPDINAVLGGLDIDAFLAAGGPRGLVMVPDDYVLPYSHNITLGTGWQIRPGMSLDLDFVHDIGRAQLGSTDRNLPASGPISRTNPRPIGRFSLVQMIENYSESTYTALEAQFRTRLRGADNLLVSYTLSRAYRDGVYFYSQFRGTQRTPDERGYNDTDQRHNVTIAASKTLPYDFQLSSIVKLVSGSPLRVQAGFDIDGDGTLASDRPPGLETTVGRSRVEESLRIINELRASRGLTPVERDLLQLDPYVSVDMRFTKVFGLGGDRRLELLMEGFNLTNYVNFQPFTINSNIISRAFLIRNSSRPARQFQWGVRLNF